MKIKHNHLILILILFALLFIVLTKKYYLIDTYSIRDDQRITLRALNEQSNWIITSPLYFLSFKLSSILIPYNIIIKYLFLILVPIFIYSSYKLGVIFNEMYNNEDRFSLLSPLITTVILFKFPLD